LWHCLQTGHWPLITGHCYEELATDRIGRSQSLIEYGDRLHALACRPEQKIPPTLRFYGWQPPGVSLGYNQSAERVVNTEFCRSAGIPIVMRPTGGSAIFHDVELTYSFVAHTGAHPDFASPLTSYFALCRALIAGVENLGAKLEIRGYSEGKEPSFSDRACFVLTSRHDVIHQGRKIIGSAQRRDESSFLQHGSILVGIRRDLWRSIFAERVDFDKIGCLGDILGTNLVPDAMVDPLRQGFQEYFGVRLAEEGLSSLETDQAAVFARDQFKPV
jgi:lipoyl(octanoyl) transferase